MNSKNVLYFRNCSKNCKSVHLKNVHDLKCVHEFKKMFMMSKIVHNFTKLRVILYLDDATKYGHSH